MQQERMEQPEEELKKIKEQLQATEFERDRAVDEHREMKKVADDANMRLSEELSNHNDHSVHSELNSVKELLSNARQGLKIKDDKIESLKLQLAQNVKICNQERIRELEMKADNAKISEANAKALLSESKKKIRELENKMADNIKSSEAEAHTKALLFSSEKKVRELEAKLTEKMNGSEAEDQTKALLSQSERKIRELETKLAEIVGSSEAESHTKALLSESEGRIRDLEMKLAENVETFKGETESDDRIRELEMEIEKRKHSEARILDSLITQTNQLQQTKVLLEEAKSKWDDESDEEYIEERVSTSRRHDENNVSVKEELESVKAELKLTKQNLVEVQKKEQLACSKAEKLMEEMRAVKHELKLTADAEENGKKAMDDLAFALKEVATEANQLKDQLCISQAELSHSRSHEERLNAMLKSSEESYKLLLDEAKKEAERHKNTAARLKIEQEESVLAWSGKETGFVDCIRRAEEDRYAAQQENFRLHEVLLETDNKAMLSKEENSKLRDILKQALNEANVAREATAIAQAENAQLNDALAEKEEALSFLTRENENYRVNEIAALENIKELKRLLIESSKEEEDGKKEETKEKTGSKEKEKEKDGKKEEKEKTASKEKDGKKEEKEKIASKEKELKKEKTSSKEILKKEVKEKKPPKEAKKEDGSKEKPPLSGDGKKEDKEKTTSKEEKEVAASQNGGLFGKVFSFNLKELKISNTHEETPTTNTTTTSTAANSVDDDDDEIELDEALKGSIFEVDSPGSATHHRRNSSTFTDEGDEFDHLDATQCENSRKKKALLRRFGDLIKRSTTYSTKKEASADTKKEASADPKKEASTADAKDEPSPDAKNEPSPE